jgi:cell shape-determining protein MreC
LGVTPSGRRHEFVIDGGLADGIELGAAVTAFTPWGLALAGRVVECGADAARVLAVTDPSSTLPVRLEAQGSGLLFQGGYPRPVGKLLHLRREVEIEPRAEVRLTDLSNAGGALIGWIVRREVETNRDGSVTQHVEVLPAVDPARLRFVWVEGQ